MEVDTPTTPTSAPELPVPLNIWCFLGAKEGTKKVKADLDPKLILTLNSLKDFVCRIVGSISSHEIDILYNGGKLVDDEAVKAAVFRPMNVLTVIKLSRDPEKPVDIAAASKNIKGQIPQISLALRTAFMNPKFIPIVMNLGTSEMLDNITAIAPGLKNDPVGVAMLQDPAMIFHLSELESLKKLANTKPWVVEALHFMAASVHQDKGLFRQGARPNEAPAPTGLFNPALIDDDDDMEDEDDEDGGAGPSGITREQLSAALNSLSAFGRGGGRLPSGSGSSGPSATGSSLFDLFSQPGGPRAAAAAQPPGRSNSADLARLLSTLQNAMGNPITAPTPTNPSPPVLTPDLVARAMNTALSSLPAEAREARFGELRDQIARIQRNSAPTTETPTVPAVAPQRPAAAPSASTRYAQQLSQMRELGVSNENLSILALRVSDGDVGTAVELILSGWTGEGADVEMPDEE